MNTLHSTSNHPAFGMMAPSAAMNAGGMDVRAFTAASGFGWRDSDHNGGPAG